jgi:hypothetical protein
VQSWTKLKSARFHTSDGTEPKELGINRETGYSEVYLPRFTVHASVELELA